MSDGIKGIVTKGHGNRFVVFAEGKYISCQLRGKVKFKADETTPVAVGDDVIISSIQENEGVIEEVLDRKSVLSRPKIARETREHVLAANIDSLIVVAAIRSPEIKPGLIDRFIIAAELGNLKPVIVLNKIDMKVDENIRRIIDIYRGLNYTVFLTSAVADNTSGNEIMAFRDYLNSHRSILAGHSGVGKSTLLNRLYPGLNLKTADISPATDRGRHTTSHIELFHVSDNGFVIDSPGIKVLGLWQIEKDELIHYYREMVDLLGACRFTGCTHTHEPDCAVKEALAQGEISRLRYENYLQIYNSL